MRGETANNSTWLSALWPLSRKIASDDKEAIGILAYEVAGVMSKVVNLWHCLSDRDVITLKEWLVNSVGVKMLVSDDGFYLMELALDEILNNFVSLAKYVAMLSKRCKDPMYHRYEQFVLNPSKNSVQWFGWEYAWKKMDRKVKKMERFVAVMSELSQELEVLVEREQTLKRMQANPKSHKGKLAEFQNKVTWHQQEVKNLRNMSPWNRSYDYIVRLLARSLFTILERIILVFGNIHLPIIQQEDGSPQVNSLYRRSHSVSAHMCSYVHPSETSLYGSCSGSTAMRPVHSESKVEKKKSKKKQQENLHSQENHRHWESKELRKIGCVSVGNDSPIVHGCVAANGGSMRMIDSRHKSIDNMKKLEKLSRSYRSRLYCKLSEMGKLKSVSSTLGDAALALHYANVIVLIEKIVSAPHFIDHQTRDDLYSKLPTAIRTATRAKLKWFAKTNHDPRLAAELSVAVTQILGWLAPLAHNMVRWHSERNFEKEHATSKANALLVQTLYFANKAKTEAAIVELLVGLNYVCKLNREARVREAPQFSRSRSVNRVQLRRNELCNKYS